MADQTLTPEQIRRQVHWAFDHRLDDWVRHSERAVQQIAKPNVAKSHPAIAAAGLLSVGMSAASAFLPAAAVPLAIPTFLLTGVSSAFQGYYRRHVHKARKELAGAEQAIKDELINRITRAKNDFFVDHRYYEMRDFLTEEIRSRGRPENENQAGEWARKAIAEARINGHSIIPIDQADIRRHVNKHYADVCKNIYEIYKRLNPEVIARATYPPFIRAANRTGKFASVGELQGFCSNPRRPGERNPLRACRPDVEAYVVHDDDPKRPGEKSDFAVLRDNAWLLKLVPRPEYMLGYRQAPLPVTHVEIVPIERKPIQPVWRGHAHTKRALATALEAVLRRASAAA